MIVFKAGCSTIDDVITNANQSPIYQAGYYQGLIPNDHQVSTRLGEHRLPRANRVPSTAAIL